MLDVANTRRSSYALTDLGTRHARRDLGRGVEVDEADRAGAAGRAQNVEKLEVAVDQALRVEVRDRLDVRAGEVRR